MDKLEKQLHRTWVQLLVDNNFKEVAAIAIESSIYVTFNEDALEYGIESAESIKKNNLAFEITVCSAIELAIYQLNTDR